MQQNENVRKKHMFTVIYKRIVAPIPNNTMYRFSDRTQKPKHSIYIYIYEVSFDCVEYLLRLAILKERRFFRPYDNPRKSKANHGKPKKTI